MCVFTKEVEDATESKDAMSWTGQASDFGDSRSLLSRKSHFAAGQEIVGIATYGIRVELDPSPHPFRY